MGIHTYWHYIGNFCHYQDSQKLEDLVEQQEMLNARLNGSFSIATQEGDLLACTFLVEPIAKLFNALQEQMRENQRNFFLARF